MDATNRKLHSSTILSILAIIGLSFLVKKYYEKDNHRADDQETSSLLQGQYIMYAYILGMILFFVWWITRIEFLEHISNAVLSGTIFVVLLLVISLILEKTQWTTLLTKEDTTYNRYILFLYMFLIAGIGQNIWMIGRTMVLMVIQTSPLTIFEKHLHLLSSSFDKYPEERWSRTKTYFWFQHRDGTLLAHLVFLILVTIHMYYFWENSLSYYICLAITIIALITKYYLQRRNLPEIPYISEIL